MLKTIPETKGKYPSFLESYVRLKNEVKFNNPLMVVGLPGIGFVSKLAADHLVKSLKAEHFATLYSPSFPNQVVALKSGNMKLFSMRFFYKKLKKRDLVILKGDVQPLTIEGQYEVSAKILNFYREMGGQEVVAMAGYAVNKKGNEPSVFCSSTSKEELKKFMKLGAKQNDAIIPIVGMAGMVPALARLYSLRGTCLLVETPGNTVDAQGASALLNLISKVMGEKLVDSKALIAKAKKAEDAMKKFETHAKQEEGAAYPGAVPLPKKEVLNYIH